jgi:hypothetical protein
MPKTRGFVTEKLNNVGKTAQKILGKFLQVVVSLNKQNPRAEKRQKVSHDDLVSLLIYLSALLRVNLAERGIFGPQSIVACLFFSSA